MACETPTWIEIALSAAAEEAACETCGAGPAARRRIVDAATLRQAAQEAYAARLRAAERAAEAAERARVAQRRDLLAQLVRRAWGYDPGPLAGDRLEVAGLTITVDPQAPEPRLVAARPCPRQCGHAEYAGPLEDLGALGAVLAGAARWYHADLICPALPRRRVAEGQRAERRRLVRAVRAALRVLGEETYDGDPG